MDQASWRNDANEWERTIFNSNSILKSILPSKKRFTMIALTQADLFHAMSIHAITLLPRIRQIAYPSKKLPHPKIQAKPFLLTLIFNQNYVSFHRHCSIS